MKFVILLTFALFWNFSFGQDIIQFKNGKTLEVKVTEVNEKEISYRLITKEGDGPIYTVSRYRVEQVQYSNGMIDGFEDANVEMADMTKAHLLEFNAIDLAFQRASFNYEYYPSEKRDWSIFVPVRAHFNPNNATHIWSYRPLFEIGLGAHLYMLRKNKMNFSMGVEANYAYARYQDWIFDQNGFWMEQTVDRNMLGFYANMHWKLNFKPRLGLNLGWAAGWRYVINTTISDPQGKIDIGVFYRF